MCNLFTFALVFWDQVERTKVQSWFQDHNKSKKKLIHNSLTQQVYFYSSMWFHQVELSVTSLRSHAHTHRKKRNQKGNLAREDSSAFSQKTRNAENINSF